MTLLTASAATTASNGSAIQVRSVLSSLTITAIDAAILAQSTRTDVDNRQYKVTMTLVATTDSEGKVQIIQSDDSKILLSDVVDALTDPLAGYRVAYKTIRESRNGRKDKIKLQIAWS